MSETVEIKGRGITLDLLLWRRWGDAGLGLVDETLELNRGLADLGPILPAGTIVVLPDAPTSTTAAVTVVDLFG